MNTDQHFSDPCSPVFICGLKNVSQLELADTSAVHIPNQQVPCVESKIIERRVRHISRPRCELWRVQGIEVIKPDLKPIAFKRREPQIDRFRQAQIQSILPWTTQDIPASQIRPKSLAHEKTHIPRIDRIAIEIDKTSRRSCT